MIRPPKTATLGELAKVALAASKLRQCMDMLALVDFGEAPRDEVAVERARDHVTIAQVHLDHALAAIGDDHAQRRLADRSGGEVAA